MLRRLAPVQPERFAFTRENLAWAHGQMTKFPEGRQASAIIPILWRAQEQEGWLTRPAIEYVAELLGMPYIRALEVATFYFMFQLQPVGRIAHVQVCGTTSCMICGAEALIEVCREKIAPEPHQLSADGNFSWEEVECLGACANAPMAQIGKDYYEDLTPARLSALIDAMAAGQLPVPGPQNGRFASEPLGGATSLEGAGEGTPPKLNASAARAVELKDTLKRIDGTEVRLTTPWLARGADRAEPPEAEAPAAPSVPLPGADAPVDATGVTKHEAQAGSPGRPVGRAEPQAATDAPDRDVAPGASNRPQPGSEAAGGQAPEGSRPGAAISPEGGSGRGNGGAI